MDPRVRRLGLSCLLLGFVGPRPPRWLADALADGLGGVVLFGSNVGDGEHVADLTAALREAAGRDIVLALDEEGGDVTRLDTRRGSVSPGAAALGALDDPAATEHAYAAIGARLGAAGVTVDLAPVADVNVDPRNPVIGVRSFGTDADLVARHVAAAVRGLQRTGVAACVKHFPGHGATVADSHHEVARVERGTADLHAVELPPFAAGIAAGARAVMTGHLLVPALDAERLATVSAPITTGLLRERLGFAGTVVTDALEMRAVSATIGIVDGFVQALAAGADAIETGAGEYPELVEAIPAAVAAALDAGVLTVGRLEDAARRTADLATRPSPVQPLAALPDAERLAARCIEVVGVLPDIERPLVIEARPPAGMASGELPWSLGEPLAGLVPETETRAVTADDGSAALAAAAADRSLIVVLRDPLRHPWQQDLVRLAARHPAAVLVDVGWPADLPADLPVVRTRGVAPGLLAAAAAVLAGHVPAEVA